MSVFDLDPKGQKKTDQQAQLNLMDPAKVPKSTFEGAGEASKSFMHASATAGRTLMTVAGAVPIAWDEVHGLFSGKYESSAQDWWFKHAVDDIGNDAVDSWTPDASQMGSGAKVLSATGGVIGSIPQLIGTPELFLANSAFSPATDLTREGVDAKTALAVGGVSLVVNAAGYKLPATFGNSLATRLATGVGANVGLGAASDAATSEVLKARGYEGQAKRYDFANMKARGIDALMGLAFGFHGHLDHGRQQAALDEIQARTGNTKADLRDALMTQLNGEHFLRGSLPGQPAHPGALAKGQKALSSAITQILHGDKVSVADMISPDDFIPQNMGTGQAPSNYAGYRRALESGGNPEASNPNSSALGIDQFTDRTWLKTVKEAKPAWAEGLTRKQILAERTDPARSGAMADVLDADNARVLEAAGQPVDNHTLYAAHHFGAEEAVAFSKASPDTPMSDILSPAQIKANPYLKGLTKNETLANWDKRAAAHRAGLEPRRPEETDKQYAKRVIDKLPDPGKLPDTPDSYFHTDAASMTGIDALTSSKSDRENAKGGNNGIKRMAAAREGVLSKRAPLDVHDNGDGTFTVVDGNGTLTAARKMGWEKLPTRTVSATSDHTGLQERYSKAFEVLPKFTDMAQSIARDVGGEAIVPGLKGVERASAKVQGDYGGEAARIKDLVRGTIKINHYDGAQAVIDHMRAKLGDPVKSRSTLDPSGRPFDESGYRGANTVWKIDGEPVEMQINIPEMLAAKEQVHALYEERSALERLADTRDLTPEELARHRELNQEMAAVFEPAWESAMARMNASSETGSPSSRNTEIGARAGSSPDQSRQRTAVGSNDQGAPLTSANRVSGENLGTPFIERAGIEATSDTSIPKQQIDNTELTRAQDVLKSNPDLQVTLDDGQTVSAADALAQADAGITRAAQDAKGFEAAAHCAMRFNDDAL